MTDIVITARVEGDPNCLDSVQIPGFAPEWPPAPARRTGPGRLLRIALVVGVLLSSLALSVLSSPVMAVVPVVALLAGWAMFAVPFGLLVPAVVGLFLAIDAPSLHPAEDKWHSPLSPVGKLIFAILPVKLAVADVLIGIVVVRALLVIGARNSDGGADRRLPKAYAQAALVALGAVVLWSAFGVGTGGSLKQTIWQVRQLKWIPCLALAVSVASATERGIARLRTAVVGTAVIKAVEGIYFYFAIVKPRGLEVAYVTTHSDSVLWALATAIVIAEWFEIRTYRTRRNLVTLVPLYALGMVLNNRRTVWVSVFASIAFIAAVAHRPVKRQLARILGLIWPLLVIYVAVGLGSHSQSIVFKPVSMIDSVMFQTDVSSSTRDIENYNLLVTLKARPLVGWGFGHEYIEASVAYDISKMFAQYRYIPHNSFLGLWAFLGPFGAGAYLLFPMVGVFYAVRARRHSDSPVFRSAGAWAVCAVIAFLVQAWADMGLQDWTALVCAAVGIGVGAALPRHVRDEIETDSARVRGASSDSQLARLG